MTNYYTYLSNSIYSAILIYLYILTLWPVRTLKALQPCMHKERTIVFLLTKIDALTDVIKW